MGDRDDPSDHFADQGKYTTTLRTLAAFPTCDRSHRQRLRDRGAPVSEPTTDEHPDDKYARDRIWNGGSDRAVHRTPNLDLPDRDPEPDDRCNAESVGPAH
jgi:hypothetical protein